MSDLTCADIEIRECIDKSRSFVMVAGAGSGKTSSLASALRYVKLKYGVRFKQNNQKVVYIADTKRAKEEMKRNLNNEDFYEVETIHSFLWNEISRFTNDIANLIYEQIVPASIKQCKVAMNGSRSKKEKAQVDIEKLEGILGCVLNITKFEYEDSDYSNFKDGKIGHYDVIKVATKLIKHRPVLQKIIGNKYPFIFVDETQDIDGDVIDAFNAIVENNDSFNVGYFGDPMQQIYDSGIGDIIGPKNHIVIKKNENYRSAPEIVKLGNRLRKDLQQISVGENAPIEGEVKLNIVQAEDPGASRNRYTNAQLDRALRMYDAVLGRIGWIDNKNSKCLFLARQIIAKRLKFIDLHHIFNGCHASQQAKTSFENGSHFLLKPFIKVIWPLVAAFENGDGREALRVLRTQSPLFYVDIPNDRRSVKKVLSLVNRHLDRLQELWRTGAIKDVLKYAYKNRLCPANSILVSHLYREQRTEEYKEELHYMEKTDWLVDEIFATNIGALEAYAEFINNRTPFSTQHGVKGEEYDNVLVFFDDVEASWSKYSFLKLFLPRLFGDGTDGQIRRTRRLAYVCLTRARRVLQIVLFCLRPIEAKEELVSKGLLEEEQIRIIEL